MSDKTILCLASYFKGNNFLLQAKAEGHRVVLLTLESLLGKPWVRDAIDEVFALPSFADRTALVNAVSFLARTRNVVRIAPLDDYDVEIAAFLREHLRLPGMGETTARYFRDKLAMRTRARERGIAVPDFVHALHRPAIERFLAAVPAPWLLKPRSEASSVGIKRFDDPAAALAAVEELGDAGSHHLLEQMIPGRVLHVDAVVWDGVPVVAEVHQYRRPLLQIWQGGGIFATRTVPRGGALETRVRELHRRVIRELGLVRGVSHTEFIEGDDGELYFLETSARVGGVHISDLVLASTGLDLWREWAKIEISQGETPYALPSPRRDYAGLIVSLARQETPDTSAYTAPEIVWRLQNNPYHVGLVVRAEDPARIEALLEEFEGRFAQDFAATMPPASSATA